MPQGLCLPALCERGSHFGVEDVSGGMGQELRSIVYLDSNESPEICKTQGVVAAFCAVVHFYGLDVWRHVRPGAKKRGGRLSTSVGGGWRRTPRGEPLPAQRPPLPDGVLPGLLLESLGLRSRFLLFCFPSRLVGSLLLFDALVHALADANRRLPRQAKPLLDHWRRRVDALLDVGRRRLGALVPEPAKLPARRQRGGLSCQCAVRADAPLNQAAKNAPSGGPMAFRGACHANQGGRPLGPISSNLDFGG